MKSSKLISMLQTDIEAFGDRDVTVFCPEHSGEHGNEPVPISGIGWYADAVNDTRSTFIVCAECHEDAMTEKAQDDVYEEIATDGIPFEAEI